MKDFNEYRQKKADELNQAFEEREYIDIRAAFSKAFGWSAPDGVDKKIYEKYSEEQLRQLNRNNQKIQPAIDRM